MKILSLVWFKVLPATFGGQKGTALFNENIGRLVPLVCLCSGDNAPDATLSYRVRAELPAGKKQVADPRAWRTIRRAVAEEKPTHLVLEYPYHAFAAVRVCRRYKVPLILHAHNLEFERFRQLGHPGWRLLKAYERWAFRNADLVLFKTNDDRDKAVTLFRIDRTKTMIVPYGIEPKERAATVSIREQLSINAGTRVLLFTGTLDYRPNAEAVEAIYHKLAPGLDATGLHYEIWICGRNRSAEFHHLARLNHPRVRQFGEVPDLTPYYTAADFFVNPVLSGGGVQTKVIDALAAGCCVVSFEFGVAGIDKKLTGGQLISLPNGNWQAFEQAVAGNKKAGRLPDEFFTEFAWPEIARKLVVRLNEMPT